MLSPDAGLTVSSAGFAASLLPALVDSLRRRTTVTLASSVPTAVLLVNTSFWLWRLEQTVSAVTTLAVAAAWGFLAVQRWRE